MSLLLVLLTLPYFGVVALLGRLFCRDAAHRKSHVVAAAVAFGLAILVAGCGVPYADNPGDRVGAPLAVATLVLGPAVFPRLGRRGRIAASVIVLAAFVEPVVRVEYLTWLRGPALQAALASEHPETRGEERVFSVLSLSSGHAEVFRVDGKGQGYRVHFERTSDGAWYVRPGSYPPQALLWYDGNSGSYNCPYPTSVLLLLHDRGTWCG
jgi:hypothetical protein